jgi:hypothetical protein
MSECHDDVLDNLRLNGSAVLVAGWSDNGWLSGGHAVRMAMERCESASLSCHLTF